MVSNGRAMSECSAYSRAACNARRSGPAGSSPQMPDVKPGAGFKYNPFCATASLVLSALSAAQAGVATNHQTFAACRDRRPPGKNQPGCIPANPFHVAIYLAHVVLGVSQKSAGRMFGRDRTSVRYACARVEDARDHEPFDQALDALSCAIEVSLRHLQPGAASSPAIKRDAAAANQQLSRNQEWSRPMPIEPKPGSREKVPSGKAGKTDVLTPAAGRLLRQLAQPGATAASSAFGPDGVLDVYAPRNGVSLRIAGSELAAADELVGRDLARWGRSAASKQDYLEISEPGRSYLVRLSSGQDGFRRQHQETGERVAEVDGVRKSVRVDIDESPLDWLSRRRAPDGSALISPVQLEAGERLRRDLELAQMMPSITANWSGVGQGGQRTGSDQHISDVVISARQRVHQALDAVGPDCAGLLVDVCGFLKGLGDVEFERSWPRRSAKVVLAMALSMLAKHYGLGEAARGPEKNFGLLHWGSAGYRPSIGGGQRSVPE